MHRLKALVVYWLPVALWMALIFTASGDAASFKHSSGILAPLIYRLFPDISHETLDEVITFFRKCAHFTEYAVLAFLVWRARRKPVRADPRPWHWSQAGEALWVAAFYASTDEFHQTFVPTREGCLRDVIIDTSGALAGLVALWLLGRWRKYW